MIIWLYLYRAQSHLYALGEFYRNIQALAYVPVNVIFYAQITPGSPMIVEKNLHCSMCDYRTHTPLFLTIHKRSHKPNLSCSPCHKVYFVQIFVSSDTTFVWSSMFSPYLLLFASPLFTTYVLLVELMKTTFTSKWQLCDLLHPRYCRKQ